MPTGQSSGRCSQCVSARRAPALCQRQGRSEVPTAPRSRPEVPEGVEQEQAVVSVVRRVAFVSDLPEVRVGAVGVPRGPTGRSKSKEDAEGDRGQCPLEQRGARASWSGGWRRLAPQGRR